MSIGMTISSQSIQTSLYSLVVKVCEDEIADYFATNLLVPINKINFLDYPSS
jgi:hypothetical protein